MPPQLGEDELLALIRRTIRQVGAETIRDKGKVMGRLMPQVQARPTDSRSMSSSPACWKVKERRDTDALSPCHPRSTYC